MKKPKLKLEQICLDMFAKHGISTILIDKTKIELDKKGNVISAASGNKKGSLHASRHNRKA